jgi:hypothetical protein
MARYNSLLQPFKTQARGWWWGCVEAGRHCSEEKKIMDVRVLDSGNWHGHKLKEVTVLSNFKSWWWGCVETGRHCSEEKKIIDVRVFDSGKGQVYNLGSFNVI